MTGSDAPTIRMSASAPLATRSVSVQSDAERNTAPAFSIARSASPIAPSRSLITTVGLATLRHLQAQNGQAGDRQLDHVARGQTGHPGRGAGEDQVAGLQRDHR